MGFTTAPYSVFASDMRQSPKTLEMVLDFAGRTVQEAAAATGIHHARINFAIYGAGLLSDAEWQKLLDVAGRRAFDEGCDDCE
jgi:hypothetical protein